MSEEMNEVTEELENQGADAAEALLNAGESHGEEQEKPFINQEEVNKAINKQFARYKSEEAARIKAEKELEDLRRRHASDQDVKIPDMPDQFDPDFDRKLSERDEAIRKYERRQFEVSARQRAEEERRQQAENDVQRQVNESVKSYNDKIKAFNLDKKTMDAHDATVAQFVSQDLARFILANDKGPLLVEHLGRNVMELEKISRMPIADAVYAISTGILPKLNPKTVKRPPNTVEGDTPSSHGSSGGPGSRSTFE